MSNFDFIPKRAFILAAGFGTRLRPYTEHVPKPMVEVAGQSLIYRTLDLLRAARVLEVVVNAHYLADVLRDHMDAYCAQHKEMTIHVIEEDEILDTGGGIVNALPYFQDEPFYVIAGDNLWEEGDVPALLRLAQHWDGRQMDILTLMEPIKDMVLTKGVGDYVFTDETHVKRSQDKSGTHMWTNIRLNHPRIYAGYEAKPFSFLPIMDKAEEAGRLHALEHDGAWHHISTPDDLNRVDSYFKTRDVS